MADAPPKVRFHAKAEVDIYARKAKAVVIRHRSGHKVIAMIEIVSPGNKSSQTELKAFVEKAIQALSTGIHLLIVDLFPPTRRDPYGIHRTIWDEDHEGDFALTDDKPLTCVSYVGMPCPRSTSIRSPWAMRCRICLCSSRRTCMSRCPWKPPTNRPGKPCRTSCRRCSPPLIARRRVAGNSDAVILRNDASVLTQVNDPCRNQPSALH